MTETPADLQHRIAICRDDYARLGVALKTARADGWAQTLRENLIQERAEIKRKGNRLKAQLAKLEATPCTE